MHAIQTIIPELMALEDLGDQVKDSVNGIGHKINNNIDNVHDSWEQKVNDKVKSVGEKIVK